MAPPTSPLHLRADPTGWGRVEAFLRLDDFIEISERGVRPSSYEKVWLPPGTIRTITIDRWSSVQHRPQRITCATAHLVDGRMVRLPGLNRPEGFLDHRKGPTVAVQQRGADDRNWAPTSRTDGKPLLWSAETDADVVEQLVALIDARCGLDTAAPSVAAAVKLRALRGYESDPPPSSLPEFLRAFLPVVAWHTRWEREYIPTWRR